MLASKATDLIREKQDKGTLIKENIDHKDIFNVKTDDNHNKKYISPQDDYKTTLTSITKKKQVYIK